MEPGSLRTLADYLTQGYWEDTSRTQRWFDMAANDGVLKYNVSGFSGDSNGLSTAGRDMVREAFNLYEATLGIDFVETTSTDGSVDFFFRNTSSGSSHTGTVESGSGGPINFATINLGDSGGIGTRAFQSALHEIGHGLGLGHQGTYNGDGDTDIPFWYNDSWQLSMMSYLDQGEGVDVDADFAYLLSPMSADWLALADNYGWQGYGPSHAFLGDTVYGFNTNITSTSYAQLASLAADAAFTIVDGGGNDTVDFSGFSDNQTINLAVASESSTAGSVSDIGGLEGNMLIGVGTVIENARGGSGMDTILGNSANNILSGAGRGDTLRGFDGHDTLRGDTGNDRCFGGDGHDLLIGGGGKDTLYGGIGDDLFEFNAAGESTRTKTDFLRAADGGDAFDAAGDESGDLINLTGLGDLHFGATDRGGISLANVGSITHCYVNTDNDRAFEFDLGIADGSVKASAYTEADFLFA